MEPEAFVNRERVSEVSQREDKKGPIPFHCSINKLHISRSLKKPVVVMGFFNASGKSNHALQKWASWGNHLASKIESTNKGLELLQGCQSLGSKLPEGGFDPLNLVHWQPGFHFM